MIQRRSPSVLSGLAAVLGLAAVFGLLLHAALEAAASFPWLAAFFGLVFVGLACGLAHLSLK